MATAVSANSVVPRDKVGGSGNRYLRSDYFNGGPQAFRIDFSVPGGVIKPHFHRVNQFQVVVGGGGTLGKAPMRSVAFHYTDGFTPYGPIVAGDQGISFFTIRATPDHSGAHYMPESRDEMERKAGRNAVCQLDVPNYRPQAVERRTFIEPHEDGLAAFTLSAGPETSFDGVELTKGLGQYYVVADGTVRHAGEDLPRLSCLWVALGEPPPSFVTADQGATLLLLQFPTIAD